MNIITAYSTHMGNVKRINQDALSYKVVNSPRGKICYAIVCDGMGGLEQGELASKEVIVAFNNWFATQFAQMIADNSFTKQKMEQQWSDLIDALNGKLWAYADQNQIMLGTTLSMILIFNGQYYICHVGDSRVYQIDSGIIQLTDDQTLVAEEVRMGVITKEQAERDPRRSILLQCVGASDMVVPQYLSGELNEPVTFLLMSDGFAHVLSDEEMLEAFAPHVIEDKEQATQLCDKMVSKVMERGERDNISVMMITVK